MFPSTDEAAHAGFVILQSDRAHAMSGSNTICVVTALLETGAVPMTEPETEVVLETAAGLVRTVATCRNGRCERVALDAPPSFVEALDVPLEVPGLGTVRVDVAYGGCYYLLVDVGQLGLRLERDAARAVVEAAQAIQEAARGTIRVQHPTVPEIDFISYVMLIGDDEPAAGRLRGATVLSGRIDRSPCGTGNSARMACMVARGQAEVGSRFTSRSLIDSEFEVEIVGATHDRRPRRGAAPDQRPRLRRRHADGVGRPGRPVPARLRAVRPVGHVGPERRVAAQGGSMVVVCPRRPSGGR